MEQVSHQAHTTTLNRIARVVLGGRHVGQRLRKKHVLPALNALRPSGKVILDAGSGKGDYAISLGSRYPSALVQGIEYDLDQLSISLSRLSEKGLSNVSFRQGDLAYPFGSNRYDIIYCVDVLEHIVQDEAALANIFQALKPGGDLLTHVPLANRRYFFTETRYLPPEPGHVRDGYEEAELIARLTGAGFQIAHQKYTFGWAGTLAWELGKLSQVRGRIVRLIAHFPAVILAWLDALTVNRWGNGILVWAKKGH